MPEKKVEEKEEKPYPITIPDWIAFLGNKSSTNVNLLVFTGYVSIIVFITLIEDAKNLPLFFYACSNSFWIFYSFECYCVYGKQN